MVLWVGWVFVGYERLSLLDSLVVIPVMSYELMVLTGRRFVGWCWVLVGMSVWRIVRRFGGYSSYGLWVDGLSR